MNSAGTLEMIGDPKRKIIEIIEALCERAGEDESAKILIKNPFNEPELAEAGIRLPDLYTVTVGRQVRDFGTLGGLFDGYVVLAQGFFGITPQGFGTAFSLLKDGTLELAGEIQHPRPGNETPLSLENYLPFRDGDTEGMDRMKLRLRTLLFATDEGELIPQSRHSEYRPRRLFRTPENKKNHGPTS